MQINNNFIKFNRQHNNKKDISFKGNNSPINQPIVDKLDLKSSVLVNKDTLAITDQLESNFSDLVEREKGGKSTIFPNCIMLSGQDPKVTNELIEWTGQISDCNFVKIKHTGDLLAHLEKAEENYKKTKDRTLLYVENLEELINPNKAPNHTIADMKAIMTSSAEDFHSTIIFNTKDPSKLDQIALQPHRVKKIEANIGDITLEELKSDLEKMKKMKNLIKVKQPVIQEDLPKPVEISKPEQPTIQEELPKPAAVPKTEQHSIPEDLSKPINTPKAEKPFIQEELPKINQEIKNTIKHETVPKSKISIGIVLTAIGIVAGSAYLYIKNLNSKNKENSEKVQTKSV